MAKQIKAKKLSFKTKLECIAEGMAYYAVSVPLSITRALGTIGPVPVEARINGSEAFIASLYPIGGGRHYLRVKNKICKSVNIDAGENVRVQITVRDRKAEILIPKDLMSALKKAGLVDGFKDLPIGKKSFILRKIDEVAKPETRAKRIQDAVEEARRRKTRA
jgi:hypothetical protein